MSGASAVGSENCLAIGTRLSDFEITGILGEGGFGIVYLAFDHALRRTVAVKEYMPGALAARGPGGAVIVRAPRHRETFDIGLKSFINEARFLAQFDHPSLVKVHRYWEQNQTAYMAMQYYQGRTIKDIAARDPALVTEAWCLGVMGQILAALEMLYTMNILHRDVSPDNIIVQDNGDAVLLDFGSARQIIGDMTKGLTVILKPGYAPIEQYAGDASLEQGAFTDIYALAAVMYFAITGEAPASSIARMVKDPAQPLRQRAPAGFSLEFLGALDQGLAVLAQDRPQTIGQFRALLGIGGSGAPRVRAPVASEAPVPIPAPLPLPPAQAPAARPRRVLPMLGGAVLLAAAGMGWLIGGPSDTVMVAQSQAPVSAAPAAQAEPEPEQEPEAPPEAAPVPAAEAEAPAAVPAAPIAPVSIEIKEKVPAPASATYRLAIKPWGAVYVDGKARGVTPPLKKLILSAGKHTVRIANPGFPDFVTQVEVGKNKGGTLEHDFAASR